MKGSIHKLQPITKYRALQTRRDDDEGQYEEEHVLLERIHKKRGWYADDRDRTTTIINCAGVVERIDEQLLPALYNAVGSSFHASPSHLGYLTLSRALVQAIASPFAGILGYKFDRVKVLTLGAAIWGTMCICFSATHSVAGAIPFWALNGIGLSFLIPTAQSMIADYNQEEHRGKAFGLLQMTGALGGLVGALYATNIGGRHVMGIEGWRFAFITVGAVSWLLGLLIWWMAIDPRYSSDDRYRLRNDMNSVASNQSIGKKIWEIITIPTFGIIILQGVVGSSPWNALVYLTLYFQLLGMSDFTSSMLLALFLLANAGGALLGGYIGDWAARLWPDHGRILVCQFSVGVGVPLSLILFQALPKDNSPYSILLYAVVLVVTGLTITWAAPACNNPIFSEITEPDSRNLIYAWDRSFEGAVAALAAPAVGILAEKLFDFKGDASATSSPEENLSKAISLGSALTIFTAVPWGLCALFFTALHFVYPGDKRNCMAKAHQLRLEMVPLANDSNGRGSEGSRAEVATLQI